MNSPVLNLVDLVMNRRPAMMNVPGQPLASAIE